MHERPAGGSRGPGEQEDGVSSEDEGVDAVLLTCPPFQLLLLHIHEDKPSFYGALKGQADVPQRFSSNLHLLLRSLLPGNRRSRSSPATRLFSRSASVCRTEDGLSTAARLSFDPNPFRTSGEFGT